LGTMPSSPTREGGQSPVGGVRPIARPARSQLLRSAAAPGCPAPGPAPCQAVGASAERPPPVGALVPQGTVPMSAAEEGIVPARCYDCSLGPEASHACPPG